MNIQIIVGSTRPSRNGLMVSEWLAQNLSKFNDVTYEVVDLAQINLPLLDEAIPASKNQYQNEHTKNWSEKVKTADGFVWVTPEYNAGYSAAIKNAIDYLYDEWIGKPVVVASYGYHGGQSAVAQLRQVAERLKMKLTETSLKLQFSFEMLDESGKLKNLNESFNSFIPSLQSASEELHNFLINK
jgi:NAD(P)H-dependent FMN reductase